jgi:hypothetical protein
MITRKERPTTTPSPTRTAPKATPRVRRGAAVADPPPPDPAPAKATEVDDAVLDRLLDLDTSARAAEGVDTEEALVNENTPKPATPGLSAEDRSLLPAPGLSATPLDLPVEVFQAGLARRQRNRASLLEWVRSALVEDIDYGRLHVFGKTRCRFAQRGEAARCPEASHWSKPSLFKPGAEKICGMLGVTVHFPSLPAYEQTAWSGQTPPAIVLRCELHDSQGRTVAEGIGARALQQDAGDLNKTLKMASKSAHIDATLRLAGLSEVFTQDLEDSTAIPPESPPAAERKTVEVTVSHGTAPPSPPTGSPASVSRAQLKYLDQRLKALGLERERVVSWIRRASRGQLQAFTDLTPELYERLLPKLERWAKGHGNGTPAHGNGRTPGGRR